MFPPGRLEQYANVGIALPSTCWNETTSARDLHGAAILLYIVQTVDGLTRNVYPSNANTSASTENRAFAHVFYLCLDRHNMDESQDSCQDLTAHLYDGKARAGEWSPPTPETAGNAYWHVDRLPNVERVGTRTLTMHHGTGTVYWNEWRIELLWPSLYHRKRAWYLGDVSNLVRCCVQDAVMVRDPSVDEMQDMRYCAPSDLHPQRRSALTDRFMLWYCTEKDGGKHRGELVCSCLDIGNVIRDEKGVSLLDVTNVKPTFRYCFSTPCQKYGYRLSSQKPEHCNVTFCSQVIRLGGSQISLHGSQTMNCPNTNAASTLSTQSTQSTTSTEVPPSLQPTVTTSLSITSSCILIAIGLVFIFMLVRWYQHINDKDDDDDNDDDDDGDNHDDKDK